VAAVHDQRGVAKAAHREDRQHMINVATLILAAAAIVISLIAIFAQLFAGDYSRDSDIKQTCLQYAGFVLQQQADHRSDASIDRMSYELSYREHRIGEHKTLAQMCGTAEQLRRARDSSTPLPPLPH
jgi:hypothetical protein